MSSGAGTIPNANEHHRLDTSARPAGPAPRQCSLRPTPPLAPRIATFIPFSFETISAKAPSGRLLKPMGKTNRNREFGHPPFEAMTHQHVGRVFDLDHFRQSPMIP